MNSASNLYGCDGVRRFMHTSEKCRNEIMLYVKCTSLSILLDPAARAPCFSILWHGYPYILFILLGCEWNTVYLV